MHYTVSEGEQLLRVLEVSKACGLDKNSTQMLKDTAASTFTGLFNLSTHVRRILERIYNDTWSNSKVISYVI